MKRMEFFGRKIAYNPEACIFLNYSFKSFEKLPKNLLINFRILKLEKPEFSKIFEYLFISKGFERAEDLGKMVKNFYILAKNQF